MAEILQNSFATPEHRTFYLECGPASGPVVFLIHGWPELSLSWRHVMPTLAALGYRVIAPELRGYGRSSIYATHDAYRQELVVADTIALADGLGVEKAVWVGHDWGTATVWNIAGHHPERCHGVANLCVPLPHDRTWPRAPDFAGRSRHLPGSGSSRWAVGLHALLS